MRLKKLTLTAILIAIFGCLTAFSTHQLKTLPSLSSNASSLFQKQKKAIEIFFQPYNEIDCQSYLSENLLEKGLQPIQVTIENRSAHTYNLSSEEVSLPTVTGSDIAWKVSKSSIPRSLLLRVGSFLYPPLTVVSTLDTIVGFKQHMKIRNDLNAKAVKKEGEAILPYSTVQRVLYVPKEEMTESFSVTLIDADSNESELFYSTIIE